MFPNFKNRTDAGQKLAESLKEYKAAKDTLILALPRGGVPVADAVAQALGLPLDVCIVRKLGVPEEEELAMGAIAAPQGQYLNRDIITSMHIPQKLIDAAIARETVELNRRNTLYRQDKPVPKMTGKTVIVVDDGIATGATMQAAIISLRQAGAKKIISALPVGSSAACIELSTIADKVICLHQPEPFYGVGQWYQDFSQTSDSEVQDILKKYG